MSKNFIKCDYCQEKELLCNSCSHNKKVIDELKSTISRLTLSPDESEKMSKMLGFEKDKNGKYKQTNPLYFNR